MSNQDTPPRTPSNAFNLPKLDIYQDFDGDTESNLSVDFNASLTPADKALLREIEDEERPDEELERDVQSRGALLSSPLLLAAVNAATTPSPAAAAAPSHHAEPDYTMQDIAEEVPSPVLRAPSQQQRHYLQQQQQDEEQQYEGEERESRLRPHEEFGDEQPRRSRHDVVTDSPALGQINLEAVYQQQEQQEQQHQEEEEFVQLHLENQSQAPPESPRDAHDANSVTSKSIMDEEVPSNRRFLYIVVGVIIVVIVVIGVSVGITRGSPTRGNNGVVTQPPEPPATGNTTLSPSRSPTTSPVMPPPPPPELTLPPTRNPTMPPTASIPVASPTTPPSSSPTKMPVSTSSPSQSPSRLPLVNLEPSLEPSLTPEEAERRSGITESIIEKSGVLALLDSNSPQFKAFQWILNDDPRQLTVANEQELMQRYSLATLLYATNVNETWLTCGPAGGITSCPSDSIRFLSGGSECNWLGVNCDPFQRVESINIRANGLSGNLPHELGVLTQLSQLIFSQNFLRGNIPTQLSSLNRLRFLLLDGNRYSGTIPTQLGNIPAIWFLHLGSNRYTGSIPPELFSETMQHIDLGGNRLTGVIPDEIFTVSSNLLNIDLSQNRLRGTIPSGLGVFSSLNSFTVDNNTLTGTLPGEIVSDTMTILDVGNNNLGGTLPTQLYTMGSSLTFLNVGVNNFRGSISEGFGNLQELSTLVFFFNEFTGTIPSSISRLSSLETLHFAGTSVTGGVPSEICQLRSLSLITLTANCGGSNPSVTCQCCTFCFDSNL